jgi:rubrerythrin
MVTEKDFREAAEKLARLREEMQRITIDEESEATAYINMALECKDPEVRWLLYLIAIDSILHRELAWAIIRAAYEAEFLARELASRRSEVPAEKLREKVKKHLSIESLAESSYKDLVEVAIPGTTLRRLIELLASEEEKHRQMVETIVKKLS